MPYNVNYTDESERLAKIARKYTQEGKNKSRKIKFTGKSKEALKRAINKRLEKKLAAAEADRKVLSQEYDRVYSKIDTELEEAAVKGTASIDDFSGNFDYLRGLGIELVNLDRKINSLNNRLIIEGRKTFNLKGITFKKVISGISRYKDAILARRDEKQAFSEKYVSVKDTVGKLMSEQEYLAAVQELGTLSNYNSIVEEISNNQGSVSTSNNETIDSAEQERLLSPSTETVLSIDELDKKFVSERKQVSDKISTLSKGMESSFEEIKKEVNDSLDSISSEVVASFDEKIDVSDSELAGEIVKKEVPVGEEKPKFDFSKFIAKPPVVGETKKSEAEDISSYSLDAAEGSPKAETKDEVVSDVTLDSIIEKLKVTSFFDDISSETTLEQKPKDKIEINPIVLDSVVDSLDVSTFFDDVSVEKTDDLIPDEIASTSSEVVDSFESIKKDVADSFDLISKKAEEGLTEVKTDSSVSDTVVEKPIVQASSEEKIVSKEAPVVDSKPDYEWLKDTYDVMKRQAIEIEEKDAEIAYLKGIIAKLRVVGNDSFGQEVSEKKI